MIRLIKIISHVWKNDEEFRALIVIQFIILSSSTFFFTIVEKWSLIDSLYFSVMTISTIGYGDLTPTNDISKLFTILMALCGIGVFVAIVTKVAHKLVSEKIEKVHKKHDKKIERNELE